jgi:hypothetical protein
MLKKSMFLNLSLSPNRGEGGVREKKKEAKFWQPIYRLSNEQDRMKRGGFGTSKSDLQSNPS